MDKILNFKFKGNRNYIQGPDMFDEIMNTLDGWNNFDECSINISQMTNRQLRFTEYDDAVKNNQVKVAQFRGSKSKESTKSFSLVETEEEVKDSYPYSEDRIVDNCKLSEKSLTIPRMEEFTVIELLVAANKNLLNQLFNDVNGKWVFTKFQSSNLKELNEATTFQLVFKKALGNFKLTVTEIIDIEKKLPVATINFTLI